MKLMTIAIKSGAPLGYLNEEDRLVVLSNFSQNEIVELLHNNSGLLQYFPDLQDDEVAVRSAMMSRGLALKYASDRLKSNSDLLFTAVSTDCWAYECLANTADVRATQEAVRRGGYNLQFVPEDKKTRNIVMTAVKESGWALCYAPAAHRDDDEIVAEAVKRCPSAVQYASPRLQQSYTINSAKLNSFMIMFHNKS